MARKPAQTRRKSPAQRSVQAARQGATQIDAPARPRATRPTAAASTSGTASASGSATQRKPAPTNGAATKANNGAAKPAPATGATTANGNRPAPPKSNGNGSAKANGSVGASGGRPAVDNGTRPVAAPNARPPTISGERPAVSSPARTSARATAVLPTPAEALVEAPPIAVPPAIETPTPWGAALATKPSARFDPRARLQQMWAWLRSLSLEAWAWIAVIALAAVLRYWGLGDKPLHHDESMHAFFSLSFARDPAGYWYDPLLHGPFQFHAEGIVFASIIAAYTFFRGLVTAQGPMLAGLALDTALIALAIVAGTVIARRLGRDTWTSRIVAGAAVLVGLVALVLLGSGVFSMMTHVDLAGSNPWINDTTARLLPATTGLFLVAITYGLRRELGQVGALAAAFCLAISPAFVYFSRFLREDIYFACFTYAVVVCAVQWARKRTIGWLIATVLAFVLAYATKESIYLDIIIWGSFLALLAVWEFGHVVSDRLPRVFSDRERAFFGHAAPLLLVGAIGAAVGAFALTQIDRLSVYVFNVQQTPNSKAALAMNDWVTNLENVTVSAILYGSIALAVLVIVVLLVQLRRDIEPSSEYAGDARDGELVGFDAPAPRPSLVARLRARLDRGRHPFLRLLLDTSWVNWFVAFVAGWVLFVALYWIVPPGPNGVAPGFAQGFQVGVGRGIWQGLYYWLQQQQVARGAQPWYYYLLLIPLYEQLAVVIGAAGIIRCLARPTRFRIFLVYWFVLALGLYSWAGEKMPWLSIHILLPLMLLAGVALDWMLRTAYVGARALARRDLQFTLAQRPRLIGAAVGLVVALVMLVPTVHGMLVLSHPDAADGPQEMMVYVQTTNDVETIMNKITKADRLMYGGKHQLRIDVGVGEEWPFYWYLRDYWLDPHPLAYATFDAPFTGTGAAQYDMLLLTEGDAATFMGTHPAGYTEHVYSLRSWWDEGYKPLPCVPTKQRACSASQDQVDTGVGLGNWLTYGDNVPAKGGFQFGKAASRVWAWLWQRQPFGSTQGSYNVVLIVRDGVPVQP
jgi:predicted membrane-bound mannosyltransferase